MPFQSMLFICKKSNFSLELVLTICLFFIAIRHIIKTLNCFSLFATHFHELTALEKTHKCVKNLQVTAQDTENNIVMLYEILQGASTRSFGIHVAKLAKFPPEVIAVAQKKAEELERADSGDLPPAQKKQRVEAYEQEIQSSLCRVAKKNIDAMSDAEVVSMIVELKQKLDESKQKYPQIAQLLAGKM